MSRAVPLGGHVRIRPLPGGIDQVEIGGLPIIFTVRDAQAPALRDQLARIEAGSNVSAARQIEALMAEAGIKPTRSGLQVVYDVSGLDVRFATTIGGGLRPFVAGSSPSMDTPLTRPSSADGVADRAAMDPLPDSSMAASQAAEPPAQEGSQALRVGILAAGAAAAALILLGGRS